MPSSSFYFAGLTVGVDTATADESMNDSEVYGGSWADGLGASGGFYTGHNDSPRPYLGITAGEGWQANIGYSKSWDVNSGVVWLFEHL